MIYGYARVSTDAQDFTSQLAQLEAAGCEKVFREKITGATADRQQLQRLIRKLAPGDVVIIPAVDRLSRDTTDLLIIAREMQKAGAGIRSLAEPFLDTTSDFAEIVFAILGVAAKLERRRILERTARGRADAKAKGVKFGRKPTLTPHQQKEAIRRRDVDGETLRSIARSYNVSPQTISRLNTDDQAQERNQRGATLLTALYPCFGLSILGLCAYNPAQPTPTYFTVGDAIAALGFTLAIQQLFRPIYRFRLRAYGLRILYLVWVVFLGAICSVIALLLPNLPISHSGFLEYPLTWELFGGLLISGAYAVVAMVSLKPAHLYSFNLIPFVRAASDVLSSADDDDRATLADDLLRGGHNVERLIRYASAWRVAEWHGADVEFDRLRAAGASMEIRGRPPISAFYLFAHRRELNAASAAGTFLRGKRPVYAVIRQRSHPAESGRPKASVRRCG